MKSAPARRSPRGIRREPISQNCRSRLFTPFQQCHRGKLSCSYLMFRTGPSTAAISPRPLPLEDYVLIEPLRSAAPAIGKQSENFIQHSSQLHDSNFVTTITCCVTYRMIGVRHAWPSPFGDPEQSRAPAAMQAQ